MGLDDQFRDETHSPGASPVPVGQYSDIGNVLAPVSKPDSGSDDLNTGKYPPQPHTALDSY